MSYKGWVLVTDGTNAQGRDALVTVRALRAAGYQVAVTTSGGTSRFARSRYCQRVVQVPEVGTEGFVPAVRREMESGDYVALILASEPAFLALGPDVPHLTDKSHLEDAASRAGIAAPPSSSYADADALLESAGTIEFPVVVKPMVRYHNAFYAASARELEEAADWTGEVLIQPFVDEPIHAVSGIAWEGRILAGVHERWSRIWPAWCGLASAAETIEPDPRLEAALERLLDGYEGIFCAQFVGPYLIDLNLRMYSSHPLAVAAGVNLAGLYCDLQRGESVSPVRARAGAHYRWLEGDLRAVVAALRARRMTLAEAVNAIRPRWRTAHSTESLTDPGPFLSRLLYASGRVRMSPEERKRAAA